MRHLPNGKIEITDTDAKLIVVGAIIAFIGILCLGAALLMISELSA